MQGAKVDQAFLQRCGIFLEFLNALSNIGIDYCLIVDD